MAQPTPAYDGNVNRAAGNARKFKCLLHAAERINYHCPFLHNHTFICDELDKVLNPGVPITADSSWSSLVVNEMKKGEELQFSSTTGGPANRSNLISGPFLILKKCSTSWSEANFYENISISSILTDKNSQISRGKNNVFPDLAFSGSKSYHLILLRAHLPFTRWWVPWLAIFGSCVHISRMWFAFPILYLNIWTNHFFNHCFQEQSKQVR